MAGVRLELRIKHLVFLLLPLLIPQAAATREYSRDLHVDGAAGDDSNAGSAAAPLKTIQRAADLAAPGDIIVVSAGEYSERVTVVRSGASGAPITFRAEGEVAMRGFLIRADYIAVDGFDITNAYETYADGNGIGVLGSFNELRNNYIHDVLFGEGIWLYGGPGRDAPFTRHNVVVDNRIVRARIAGILVEGMNNRIEGNDISHTIQNPPGAPFREGADADGIRFFGSGHVIRGNTIHDITMADTGNLNPHIDGLQTWGPAWDILIENNWIGQAESPNQGIIVEGLVQPVGNITIENNVFTTNGTQYSPAVLAGGRGLVTNVRIVNNTMTALNGAEYAIWLSADTRGAVVRNNTISGHGDERTPYIRVDGDASELEIGFNSISKKDGRPPADFPRPGDWWIPYENVP